MKVFQVLKGKIHKGFPTQQKKIPNTVAASQTVVLIGEEGKGSEQSFLPVITFNKGLIENVTIEEQRGGKYLQDSDEKNKDECLVFLQPGFGINGSNNICDAGQPEFSLPLLLEGRKVEKNKFYSFGDEYVFVLPVFKFICVYLSGELEDGEDRMYYIYFDGEELKKCEYAKVE